MCGDRASSAGAGPSWSWERVSGPVGALVTAEVPQPARRLVRVMEPHETAFVLGSTQPEPVGPIPHPTVRRRSGGGGVLLTPDDVVWVDIVIPRDDPWWDDDVGRAAQPVGLLWATAFRALGLDGQVHRGALVASQWSTSLCFAGLGPGEVTVDGRKVLGLAQRRTRAGACFQCAVSLRPPGRASAEAAGMTGAAAEAATSLLGRSAGSIDRLASDLLGALSGSLGR